MRKPGVLSRKKDSDMLYLKLLIDVIVQIMVHSFINAESRGAQSMQ